MWEHVPLLGQIWWFHSGLRHYFADRYGGEAEAFAVGDLSPVGRAEANEKGSQVWHDDMGSSVN